MNFTHKKIMSEIEPKKVLVDYYEATGRRYRVMHSLTQQHWLAFFRPNEENELGLIGPPVPTKQAAVYLCEEHHADLPW